MEKLDLLASVDLFSQLSRADLSEVAGLAAFADFGDGEIIYSAGSSDQELFVIDSGQVRIVRRDRSGEEMDLARFVTGESFGELDFMSTSERATSAVSQGDTRLLIFPSRGINLNEVILSHPTIFAKVMHQLLAVVAGRIRSTNSLISENSSWVQNLRKQVFGDKLTGLYARTYLDDEIPGMMGRWKGESAFLMVKPDNFKIINDTYGHEIGDQVLRILANQIKRLIREGDIAIRFRGNEFAVVLPQTSREDAVKRAAQIRLGMNEADLTQVVGKEKVPLTFSVGIAIYPDHGSDSALLAEAAHDALFAARDAGGDQIRQSGEGVEAT